MDHNTRPGSPSARISMSSIGPWQFKQPHVLGPHGPTCYNGYKLSEDAITTWPLITRFQNILEKIACVVRFSLDILCPICLFPLL